MLDQQHQLQPVDGGRFEPETLIEGARPFVLCVNEKRPDSGDVGRLKGAEAGIPQQAPADFFSLMADIHRQSRQNHHRNGMPSQALPDPICCAGIIYRTHG